jgi:hypothetical protein
MLRREVFGKLTCLPDLRKLRDPKKRITKPIY